MDYKNTLNLPQTDFPMKADLVTREPLRLEKWRQMGLYERILKSRVGAEKFVLHDGPPFANGDVHIGTALNKILKDLVVKYHSLRGKSAPYIPGWDCHGLPIEFKVTQDMRKEFEADWPNKRKDLEYLWKDKAHPESGEIAMKQLKLSEFLSPATIRKACDAYARKYIDLQRVQFKRLGILGDWDNPYLTLDKQYEANELRLFADIVEQGLVYRGKKPVYWSIPARTALAEAEVEYHDHVSQSIYVKFPVIGQANTFIVIWTTTPWTLPANLAVAYNPKLTYLKVKVGEEIFLVAEALLQKVSVTCNWSVMYPTKIEADDLATLKYQHPFIPARTGKAFAADFVTSDTGTGFVHIAPGHGLDDYNLGRQNGLLIYSPVNDDGCLVWTDDLPLDRQHQMPEDMLGKSILEKHGKSDANEAVLHELRLRKVLLHQENYHHSYPYCWRSKTAIIFRAMDQWFIRIDEQDVNRKPGRWSTEVTDPQLVKDFLATKPFQITGLRRSALNAIEKIDWIPLWGKNRIQGAVMSRPDWCISRQRSWGVPIPAFRDGEKWILDARIIRKLADHVEEFGSNFWFADNAGSIYGGLKLPNVVSVSSLTELQKSNDTLDVWIDSGSSSRAVLMKRKELLHRSAGSLPETPTEVQVKDAVMSALDWQADVYLEGSDQHRGWFQSSLLLSLAGNGAAPFKTVLTHGFMVDADREKISKSKQGANVYEKPQTAEAYVKKYGADVVRLWVASQDYRSDIVVSDERINKVSETYRGIRNTLRYQLSNLFDFDPAKHAVREDELTSLDLWILSEFTKLESEVIAAYDRYEFHVVYQKLSQFIAVELSSIYHDVVKDRLYTDAANSPRRRSTQTALHRMVIGLCQMLSPILAFTADEAWEFVPKKATDSVHEDVFKPSSVQLPPDEIGKWEWLNKWRGQILPELEKARQAKTIGKGLDAKVQIVIPKVQDKYSNDEVLRELVNVSALKITVGEGECVTVAKADGQKCERCWHWETDVGSNPEHPTICARCIVAVKENLAGR